MRHATKNHLHKRANLECSKSHSSKCAARDPGHDNETTSQSTTAVCKTRGGGTSGRERESGSEENERIWACQPDRERTAEPVTLGCDTTPHAHVQSQRGTGRREGGEREPIQNLRKGRRRAHSSKRVPLGSIGACGSEGIPNVR